jgi:hypothetical protein
VCALALAAAVAADVRAQQQSGDPVYTGQGVVIVWGIMRWGSDPKLSDIVIRVSADDSDLTAVSVDGVDPATRRRVTVVQPQALTGFDAMWIPRVSLIDHPRTEVRFGRRVEDLAAGRARVAVSFSGIPEGTPEFTSAERLGDYFARTMGKARAR